MKAVIYARYSSDKQTEASIEAQVRACTEYAQRHDMEILSVYADEAISGKGSATAKRRQYQKMLRDAEKGEFSFILIHQYDRIARNLAEHVNLEAKLTGLNVQLVAVQQDFGVGKEAKIMRALLWSLSEYYIDNLAVETRKGHRETALKGLHNGGYPPFGYDVVDQTYVVNPLEAEYVRRMFATASAGGNLSELAREMQKSGIVGKRGRPIKRTQIYEILQNEKYTGVYLYTPTEASVRGDRRKKTEAIRIEGAIPKIVDKEVYERVQAIMRNRKHVGRKSEGLCSGLVYCECGAKMHRHVSTGKGHTYHYYRCSAKCGAIAIREEEVDAAAIAYLNALLDADMQALIFTALRRYSAGTNDRAVEFKKALIAKIAEKEKQCENIVANLSLGVLPPDAVAELGKKLTELRSEIEALKTTEPPADISTDLVAGWLEKIKKAPDQEAVKVLIERIDIKATNVSKITSTLKRSLELLVAGVLLMQFYKTVPQILFEFGV